MTNRSRVLLFFPAFHGLSALICFIIGLNLMNHSHFFSGAEWFGFSLFLLYLLPPFLYRIHNFLFPIRIGFDRITSQKGQKKYNAWWGTHQLQILFIAFPALESALRIIPGLYSAWLRLWGAEIGRSVYWTPRAEIIDRGLVKIGDYVLFGHDVALCSHVVTPGPNGLRIYIREIKIGNECLIGAKSKFGPGVQIANGLKIPYSTEGRINQIFSKEDFQVKVGTHE